MPNDGTSRPATIVLWLMGALGDTLLGFPAFRALRTWAPTAQIIAAGRPAYLAFAQTAGLVDAVVDADGPAGSWLFNALAPPAFDTPDLAIVWSAAYRALADRLLSTGTRSVIASSSRSADGRHQARYLLDCLRPLGVSHVLRPVSAPIMADTTSPMADVRPGPVIVLHPGAGAGWKRWPLEEYLELAERLRMAGCAIHWSFGPAEAEVKDAFISRLGSDIVVEPDRELSVFSAFLAHADLLVSADTGVAHLAAFLGVPQVVLFGPTDARRWRPLSRTALVLHAPSDCGDWPRDEAANQLVLRRCRASERARCRCLAGLSVEAVLSGCRAVLARHSAHRLARSNAL